MQGSASYLRSRVQRPHHGQTIALSHFDDITSGSVQLWRCQLPQAAFREDMHGMAGIILLDKALAGGDDVHCIEASGKLSILLYYTPIRFGTAIYVGPATCCEQRSVVHPTYV